MDQVTLNCPRCGTFRLDPFAVGQFAESGALRDKRYLVSAALRAASERKLPLTVTVEALPAIVSAIAPPTSLFDHVDRLLLLFASRVTRYRDQVVLNNEVDYPLLYARGPQEANDLVHLAEQLGYYNVGEKRIQIAGWRRLDELRRTKPESDQAFVAMWFHDELDPIWSNGIKPGIEAGNRLKALRMKELQHNEKIDDRIIAEIRRSKLVVADFTGQRGGVYYEAGFAQGLGIPVIWTCRKDATADLHFDTRQYNHIEWSTADELRERLADRIAATILA
jgi:nucleoside 2-deoxyribosyltransferase